MEKRCKLGVFLIAMSITFGPTCVLGFNSAAHLYIAEQVFPMSHPKNDLYYGSIAPDIVLYLAQANKWPTAFDDTHYNYIDLKPYAWSLSLSQEAFADGWWTHNEAWGADFYAHGVRPEYNGYVNLRAKTLSEQTGLNFELMHFAIEVAIDLLLKNDDPQLGEKLLKANQMHSGMDRYLLFRVFALEEMKTNWITLGLAEMTFRNFVDQYAEAFALPSPQDKEALAELGVELAQELYETVVTKEELLGLLESALNLCGDYREIIDTAIDGINLFILGKGPSS